MGRKAQDIPTKISFEKQRVHTVEFNPALETVSLKNRDGEEYEAFLVKENGAPRHLTATSSRLVQAIQDQNLTGPSILRITKSGQGYEISYAVENLGPVNQA